MDCVVVTYNSAPDLKGFIACDSIRQWFDRIIVVDNASSDDSVELAREAGFDVIELGANLGYAAASNAGIRASDSEIVTLMNADIRADACGDFLSLIANFLDPEVAVAAPTLILPSGEIQDSARQVPRPHELVVRRWLDRKRGQVRPTDASEVPWVVGACMLIRKEAFDAVGGFDERYPLYFEDVDFCVRLTEAGWKTLYDPTVRMDHFHRGDSRKSLLGASTRRHVRSAARFYAQHPSYALGRAA